MNLINIFNQGREISLFCRNDNGDLEIKTIKDFFPYFYEKSYDGNFKSYKGDNLRKMFVSIPRDVPKQRSNEAFEADILFTKRYLIDKVKTLDKCPIKYAFIDIEVQSDELPNVQLAEKPVSCITVYNSFTKEYKTFFLKDYENEYKMIDDFIRYMKQEKFDLWLSWHVGFDYDYLYNRIPDFAQKISPIGKTRYGKEDVYYPAGISIVDYLSWFKKVTLNKEKQYTLDYIAEKHLGKGKTYNKVDFSKVSEEIRKHNIEDVKIMVELEKKFKLISYYDEVRRLAKVEWEDLIWNSRTIDMLLLQEAKNQNVVLPMKPKDNEKEDFLGAYREAYGTGAFYNIGKYDLSSAYPFAIINFCLDPANICYVPIDSPTKEGDLRINKVVFRQNENALLPTVVKRMIILKNNIKKELNKLALDSPEYKNTKTKYEAIKSIVNSCYGVMGNRFFRLYDKAVASATTFIVRDLLHYVKDNVEAKGYKIIYVDTDSVFIDSKENLTDFLNELIQKWGKEKYGKEHVDIDFAYEGSYTKLLILAKCLDGRTLIKTTKGYKRLNWIYRNKYKGNIYCLNDKGKLITSKILNSYKNALQNRKLYKVVLLNNNDTLKKPKGAILTEDHKILTNHSWKPITKLKKEDKIHSGTFMPSKEKLQVLTGTLLGDTSISNNILQCAHSIKQKQYLLTKAKMFECDNRIIYYKIKNYYICKFTSLVFPYLRKLRKLFYPNNKKKITKKILENYSLISLAFHFMDDGYLRQKRTRNAELAVCGYSRKGIKLLSQKIQELGIDNSVTKYKRIYFTVQQTKKLSKLIAPYVTKSMNYKLLPEHRKIKKYIFQNKSLPFYDDYKLIRYYPLYPSVYDLEIKNYHNFMTLSGIVHNCRYIGYLQTGKGMKEEVKGVEAKRKDSTVFMKKFQRTLIDKILDKEPKKEIIQWINEQVKEIRKRPIAEIAFPCKLARKPSEYKNVPIFLRALNSTPNFSKKVGNSFYYIYMKPFGHEEIIKDTLFMNDKKFTSSMLKSAWKEKYGEDTLVKNMDEERKEMLITNLMEKGVITVEKIKTKGKIKNVKAFDDDEFGHINRDDIDFKTMINRNIYMKLSTIFEAMQWDMGEVINVKIR